MKSKKWFLMITLLIAVIIFPTVTNAAKVKINKKKASVYVGETVQLKVTGTSKKPKWSSSNKKVATVNKKGRVRGKKVGKATIKAKIGGKQYKCKITVKNIPQQTTAQAKTPAKEMSLSVTKLQLEVGQQKQLTLKNGGDNVKWSSSDYNIACVDSDGVVYGKFLGTCKIKAICEGKTFWCDVTVKFPVPECYPQNTVIEGYRQNISIGKFEAEFVSYKPYRGVSTRISDGIVYYLPYTYRIRMKGTAEAGSSITLRFCALWNGRTPGMPENSFINFTVDESGSFEVDENVRFCSPAEIIYVTY